MAVFWQSGQYICAPEFIVAGAPSSGRADRRKREVKHLSELEAENRALHKKIEKKDEVIDLLKKSVGILSKP